MSIVEAFPDRQMSDVENLAFPILEDAFKQGTLSRELTGLPVEGFEERTSIDWATTTSQGKEVRVGIYRTAERYMGILITTSAIKDMLYIRSGDGELKILASNDPARPTVLPASRKEGRLLKKVKKILSDAEFAEKPATFPRVQF